jgi:hypothetical protein
MLNYKTTIAGIIAGSILALFACSKTQETKINALAQHACEAFVESSPKAQALADVSKTPVQALAQYVCQDASILAEYAKGKGEDKANEILDRLVDEAK